MAHQCGHYGRLRTKTGPQSWLQAHRLSWEIHNGPIAEGLVVRHLCGNTLCVRPDHLAVGTVQDNIDDRGRDGNHPAGERNHWAKLTEAIVREIRSSVLTNKDLAKQFKVNPATISHVRRGKSWRHAN